MSFEVPGDLALNADGTDLAAVQGSDEIAAAVDAALQVFQGTWIFDTAAGLPPFTELYNKPADTDFWRASVWKRVAEVDGVERPTGVQVSFDRAARKMQIVWAAQTVAGAATSMVEYQ